MPSPSRWWLVCSVYPGSSLLPIHIPITSSQHTTDLSLASVHFLLFVHSTEQVKAATTNPNPNVGKGDNGISVYICSPPPPLLVPPLSPSIFHPQPLLFPLLLRCKIRTRTTSSTPSRRLLWAPQSLHHRAPTRTNTNILNAQLPLPPINCRMIWTLFRTFLFIFRQCFSSLD